MSYQTADGFKIRDQSAWHYLTFTVVDWIDLFTRRIYRDMLIKNMQYCCKQKQLRVGAFVIMSNHLHLIWQSEGGRLSDTIRDFKSYSTKQFIETIRNEAESRREGLLRSFHFHANQTNQNKDYKIWTGNNYPEEIYSKEFMMTKLNYLHENPGRAGWVKKAQAYLYSSASNYCDGSGVMDIHYLY